MSKKKYHIYTQWIDHIMVCFIALMFEIILIFLSINLSIFNPLKRAFDDFSMSDMYYQILNDNDAKSVNDKVVLVDMTKQYRREEIANTINEVTKCQPRVTMIDLIFERINDNEEGNKCLIEAISEAKNPVLACKLLNYSEEQQMFNDVLYSFFEDSVNVSWGYSNVLAKFNYGTIRQYTTEQVLNGQYIYSMPYLAACKYKNEKAVHSLSKQRYIAFDNIEFPVIPCDSISNYASLLRDKIVIIGTYTEEADIHVTPIGKMAGMKILAYSTVTNLEHKNIIVMSSTWSVILAIIVGLFSSFIGFHINNRFPNTNFYIINVFYFLIAAFLTWIAFISFVKYDFELKLLYPLITLALIEQARLHYKWFIRLMERRTSMSFIRQSIYSKQYEINNKK